MEQQLNIFDMIKPPIVVPEPKDYIGRTLKDAWEEGKKLCICVHGKWTYPTWIYHGVALPTAKLSNHVLQFFGWEIFEYSISGNDIYVYVKAPNHTVMPDSCYQSLLNKHGDSQDSEYEENEEDEENEKE